MAACVRNSRAVARWLRDEGYGRQDAAIGIVAAGERWPDGALRPCVEDLLGAACVLDGLSILEVPLSVEAVVTLAALASIPDIRPAIVRCASGQELLQ